VETTEESGQEPSSEAPPRIIKRYANRKLYDTRDSRYVTLQEIARFVRGSDDVRIIDNRTKEDLTNVTLAQIIYEEEKKGDEARSIRSLRDFIQQGKSRMREGRERLIESIQRGPVGKLVTRREGEEVEEIEEIESEDAVDAGESGVEESATQESATQELREAWSRIPRMADEGLRSLLQTALTHVQQLQSEVQRLGGRIEDLEGRLSRRNSARDVTDDTNQE